MSVSLLRNKIQNLAGVWIILDCFYKKKKKINNQQEKVFSLTLSEKNPSSKLLLT